jgi:hypothetical protein
VVRRALCRRLMAYVAKTKERAEKDGVWPRISLSPMHVRYGRGRCVIGTLSRGRPGDECLGHWEQSSIGEEINDFPPHLGSGRNNPRKGKQALFN